MNLESLYQDVIIDHSRSPRNFGELEGASHKVEGFNPLCGDQVTLYLKMEGDRVADAHFTGTGCAISIASASLLTEAIRGKSRDDALEIFRDFRRAMMGECAMCENAGSLVALEGVREYPMRIKCATLPWHALHTALTDEKAQVTTEDHA
ncbi:MAG: Zinc-dependent sulfurtransferase SufU [Fimbriimonadaceae bacterium]|nr:Zinc-dependent sulfurtransferase SufU [Fimbriimonadaceae bacterium]